MQAEQRKNGLIDQQRWLEKEKDTITDDVHRRSSELVELQRKVSEATRELREKNAELVESYERVLELREQGVPLDEAVTRAGEIRFLPIILTSATAIGGLLPLAVQGSGLYSPLAIVIIGGLITSTLISGIVTPVMYRLLPPKIEPSTPRMICRPIWLPIAWAALLAMDSRIVSRGRPAGRRGAGSGPDPSLRDRVRAQLAAEVADVARDACLRELAARVGVRVYCAGVAFPCQNPFEGKP